MKKRFAGCWLLLGAVVEIRCCSLLWSQGWKVLWLLLLLLICATTTTTTTKSSVVVYDVRDWTFLK